MKGTVDFFSRGWGFIDGEDGIRYFVYRTDINAPVGFRHLLSGQQVEFEARAMPRGMQAFDVKPDTFTHESRESWPTLSIQDSSHLTLMPRKVRKYVQGLDSFSEGVLSGVPLETFGAHKRDRAAVDYLDIHEQVLNEASQPSNDGSPVPPYHLTSPGAENLRAGTLDEVATRIDSALPEMARLLTLRFFGGLTLREIAAKTNKPLAEVKREWEAAKEWLQTQNTEQHQGLASQLVILPPISKRDLRILHDHPELLKTLDWRSFEQILAEVLESLGYQIELQRGTKDGGIDIFALRHEGAFGTHRYIVQAKRWSHRVGVGPVKELLFLQGHLNVTKSCLATTTGFTRGARELANEYRWQLELRDFVGLQEWIRLAAESVGHSR